MYGLTLQLAVGLRILGGRWGLTVGGEVSSSLVFKSWAVAVHQISYHATNRMPIPPNLRFESVSGRRRRHHSVLHGKDKVEHDIARPLMFATKGGSLTSVPVPSRRSI